MAYTPTVWETGDTITAVKLNKMENGIAGAVSLPVYTFTQNSAQDEYTAMSQDDTQKVRAHITNHELFFINVKLFSEESASAPILILGAGTYDGQFTLAYPDGLTIAPQGMSGTPHYDETSSLFVWNIYID